MFGVVFAAMLHDSFKTIGRDVLVLRLFVLFQIANESRQQQRQGFFLFFRRGFFRDVHGQSTQHTRNGMAIRTMLMRGGGGDVAEDISNGSQSWGYIVGIEW